MFWLILLVVIAVIAALPWTLEKMRRPMSPQLRKSAPGSFVNLSEGVTHYQWLGPVRGPVAVLIHGLSTSSDVWQDIAQGLGDSGYRVLVYDLYGRGFSDASKTPQTTEFFVAQLDELLAHEGLSDDLTLVGYSMGGTIATAFAATEPHRMKRLILLAPAGIEAVESDFSKFCRTKPFIGDWLHGLLAGWRMRAAIARDPARETAPNVIAAQKAEIGRQGFLPAVLSSRRHALVETQEAEHRGISRDGIPVIAIWGDQDKVIPVSALGTLAQWNRTAHHEVVKGAGHELPYSHGAEVVEFMRTMLRAN